MKNKLMIVIGLGVALLVGGAVRAEEQDEEIIPSSQVPAVVKKAAEKEAEGGKLVQWEKEGKNYEAIIEKNGKQRAYPLTRQASCKANTTRATKLRALRKQRNTSQHRREKRSKRGEGLT